MSRRKQALIEEAREKYGEVQPCANRKNLGDCFTEEAWRLHFWFNVQGGNTRVLIEGRLV